MEIPEGFKFMSLSLPKGGGLIVEYGFKTKDGSITNKDSIKHTCCSDMHDDMEKLINKLKVFVADTYNILAFKALAKNSVGVFTAKEQTAVKNIQPVYTKLEKEILDKIEITALKAKGTEKNFGLVISAKNNYGKAGTAMNTPFINLGTNKWGWEEELDELFEMIVDESKEYLFNNKRKQPEFDFVEENNKGQKKPKEKELAPTGSDDF